MVKHLIHPQAYFSLSEVDRAIDDLPVLGPSVFSFLYSRLSSAERTWPNIVPGMVEKACLPFGARDPWGRTRRIDEIYSCFCDEDRKDARSRAEKVVETMVTLDFLSDELDDVPFGVAIPIRESLRLCQMIPPSEWPLSAYELLGRKDLAEMAKGPDPNPPVNQLGLQQKV